MFQCNLSLITDIQSLIWSCKQIRFAGYLEVLIWKRKSMESLISISLTDKPSIYPLFSFPVCGVHQKIRWCRDSDSTVTPTPEWTNLRGQQSVGRTANAGPQGSERCTDTRDKSSARWPWDGEDSGKGMNTKLILLLRVSSQWIQWLWQRWGHPHSTSWEIGHWQRDLTTRPQCDGSH